MYTVQHGRPSDTDSRLQKENHAYDLLDRLGVNYDRVDHPPAMTMEACAEIDRALGTVICKNLFLRNRQGSAFYLLLIPDAKRFKTKDLSAQLGVARLSFGGSEDMERLLDLTPGSVSVLGLPHDTDGQVQLLIDRDLLAMEDFGCHPCINTSSVRFPTRDLLEKVIPALGHEPVYVTLPDHPEESDL